MATERRYQQEQRGRWTAAAAGAAAVESLRGIASRLVVLLLDQRSKYSTRAAHTLNH